MGQRVSQIDQENLQKVVNHLITTKLCGLMGQPDHTEEMKIHMMERDENTISF
jgi:hypothetical protein